MLTTECQRYTICLEDDPLIHFLIESSSGMPSVHFHTIAQFMNKIDSLNPTAIFIDIHLADGPSGLEIIPELRRRWAFIPIIVITADSSDDLLADALALGADDFIRKPIKPRELMARLQTRLKEHARHSATAFRTIADIKINTIHNVISGNGAERYLSKSDMALLVNLIDAKGTLVTRSAMKRLGWGNLNVTEKALDRRIHLIRSAVYEVSQELRIRSVYGEGFKLQSVFELNSEKVNLDKE